jgi:hypothetical protein
MNFLRGILQRFDRASDDYLANSLKGRFALTREEADAAIEAARSETGVSRPKPLKHEDDRALFTCDICSKRFLVVHVEPTGEHKLREVNQ